MRAGMQIDITGQGVMDVFNEYLPVSYVESYIQLPEKYSQNNKASFEFNVPPEITGTPFFYVMDDASLNQSSTGYYPFFTHLGGTRWRLTLWGYGYRSVAWNGNSPTYMAWQPYWKEPIMKSTAKILVGGYRG